MIVFTAKQNKKLSKAVSELNEPLPYYAFFKLLRDKDIKVNGKRIKEDVLLEVGDKVEIYYTLARKEKFNLLFEDENIVVINKFSGFTSEDVFDTLSKKYKDIRFVHRLDRNTSGIMIFALNFESESELLFGFKKRTFDKKYKTEVIGKMPKKEDVLTAYLVKDSEKAQVKIFDKKVPDSVEIKTGYKVLQEKENTSILEITLFTGKTHQIRAHLSHIGHPVLGDGKYGDNKVNKTLKVKSQILCSYKLTLHFEKTSRLNYLNNKTFTLE